MSNILALDIGDKRVGVAIASTEARMPRPLLTIDNNDAIFDALTSLFEQESIETIVAGLPRGLDGQHTEQTRHAEAFVAALKTHTSLAVHFQDEALTSKAAETELDAAGKPYTRGDIDALAACYILTDYLSEHRLLTGENA